MKKIALISMLLVVMGFVAAAQADPITVNDPLWYEFSFTAVGVQAQGAFPDDPLGDFVIPSISGNSQNAPAPAWTFSSLAPTFLTVVDAFLEGDAFNVFDFGLFIGGTTAVANTGNDSGTDDPVVALLDPDLSRGFFFLAAGNHSLTIEPYQIAGPGAAYFMVSAIPVPATLPLVLTGLGALVAWRRRSA
ncbi:MAG: VPLPA-CTERM sorting domain-containing protein [Desulfobaccales bacterium]